MKSQRLAGVLRNLTRSVLYLVLFLGCGARSCEKKQTPGIPVGIAKERALYVTDNGSDAISVVDRDSDAVLHVPLDLDSSAHEAPHHIAIDGTGGRAFVPLAFPPEGRKAPSDPHASHGGGEDKGLLARIDPSTCAILATREVDANPGDVALSHDRRRVLVTHFDMKRAMSVAAEGKASPATMFARLLVLSADTLQVTAERPLCVAPHGIAITKDDKLAFVACYGSDELAIVDLTTTDLTVQRHPLGAQQGIPGVPRYGPYSVALSPNEKLAAVGELEGQGVRIFDREAKAFVQNTNIPTGGKAFFPEWDGDDALIVPVQGPDAVVRIDVGLRRVTARRSFDKSECQLPHVVRRSRTGRTFVVCEGDHVGPGAVLELDRTTLATVHRWSVGIYPDGIAFGED